MNKSCKDKFFSPEFKDFIEQMLQLEPSQRPSMEDIINHPWIQGPTPTKQEVVKEFKKRQQLINKNIEDQMEVKAKEKVTRTRLRAEAAVVRKSDGQ